MTFREEYLFYSNFDLNWIGIVKFWIGFRAKLKIHNSSLISSVHFNFFSIFDCVTSVLFKLKVLGDFVRSHKSYKQITHMKFIILYFQLKFFKNFYNVLECVLSYNLILQWETLTIYNIKNLVWHSTLSLECIKNL